MTTGCTAQPPAAVELPVEKVATIPVPATAETAEGRRLLETHGKLLWRRWGPVVRQNSDLPSNQADEKAPSRWIEPPL